MSIERKSSANQPTRSSTLSSKQSSTKFKIEKQSDSERDDETTFKGMNSRLTTATIIKRTSDIFAKAAICKLVFLILINKLRVSKILTLQKFKEIIKSSIGVSLASAIFLTLQILNKKAMATALGKSKLFQGIQFFISGCIASLAC